MDSAAMVLRQPHCLRSPSPVPSREFRTSSKLVMVNRRRNGDEPVLSSEFHDRGHMHYYKSNNGGQSSSSTGITAMMSGHEGKTGKEVSEEEKGSSEVVEEGAKEEKKARKSSPDAVHFIFMKNLKCVHAKQITTQQVIDKTTTSSCPSPLRSVPVAGEVSGGAVSVCKCKDGHNVRVLNGCSSVNTLCTNVGVMDVDKFIGQDDDDQGQS